MTKGTGVIEVRGAVVRRARLLAAALLSIGLEVGLAVADGGTPANRGLDGFVRAQMDRLDVPGAAYAVVGPDRVLRSGTFGVTGDGQRVSSSTPFLWGSLAKPATATVVMTLVEDGKLDLDTPVVHYLPAFRLTERDLSRQVTLRHLLAHTSGIPTSVALTDRYDEDRRPRDVLPALAATTSMGAPGTEFHYSSVNYLVLTAVVEAVTGQRFSAVLERRMLDPLGMAGAVTSAAEAAERLPAGHRYVLGRPVSFRTSYDPAGLGYGYLGGTLEDATAWARAALGGSEAVLDDRQRAAMVPDLDGGEETAYGLGWRRWPLADQDGAIVWHGGAAPGYQAALLLLPEQDRAVVVLQNVYGVFADRALLDTAFGVAALVAGEEPERTGSGPAYPTALAALAGLLVLTLALLVRSVRRLRRGHRRPLRTARIVLSGGVWLTVLGAASYALGVWLPSAAGVGLEQVVLWAPDVAWLLWAVLGAAALLGAARVAVVIREAAAVRSRSRYAAAKSVARPGAG